MAKLTKCPNCGGKLEYISHKNAYKCLHCGSSFAQDEEPKEVQTEPQAEDQPKVEQTAEPQKVNYEKESYSDMSYREVQKARLRGKMYKLEVPELDHMLHKTEKKRTAYVVFAIIMFVIATAVFALTAYMAVIMLPALFGAQIVSPEWDVIGIASGLAGFGIFLGIVAALAILGIFGAIGGYLIYTGRRSLQLSTATKEEMAYGPTITRFILSSVVVVIATIVIAFALLFIIKNNSPAVIGTIIGVAALVVIGFVAMLVKLLRDKVQAVKWFKTLPEAEQTNYREHADAIKSVRHRKEMMDQRNRRIFWR